MNPLRQPMIEAIGLRGFSERSDVEVVSHLAHHYGRGPSMLNAAEIEAYFIHLALERKLAPASIRLQLNGVRFFYLKVLKWASFALGVTLAKRAQRIARVADPAGSGRYF